MIADFFVPQLNGINVEELLFQQDGATWDQFIEGNIR